MAKYKVGIIGCGSHGTRLARAFQLNPSTEVVAGVNRSQEGLDLFCGRFDVPGYHDYKEMLEKEDIDIAAPILPVKHNPQAVIDCARAGVKGIFCDKPIAASLEEADRMVEECRKLGVPVIAGDMFRNDPDMWKARTLVESGEIGGVLSINVYGTGGNQASGQGCRSFTDMAMFAGDGDIDWVVGWVTGDPADRELGKIDEWSDADQEMGGYVRYANGIEAFLHHRTAPARTGLRLWEPAACCTENPPPGSTASGRREARNWWRWTASSMRPTRQDTGPSNTTTRGGTSCESAPPIASRPSSMRSRWANGRSAASKTWP